MKRIDKLTEFEITGFNVDYSNYNTVYITLKRRKGEINKNKIEGYIELTAELAQLLEAALKNKKILNKPVFDKAQSERVKAMSNEELDRHIIESLIEKVGEAGGWDKFLNQFEKKTKKSKNK
jgi:hypothetical protein